MDTWGSWYFLYFCIYLQPFIIKKSKKRRKCFLGWGENWVTKQWTCRCYEILKKLFCHFFLSQIKTLRRILKSSYRFVELESWEACALLPRKAWARSKIQCGTECMVCANRPLASQFPVAECGPEAAEGDQGNTGGEPDLLAMRMRDDWAVTCVDLGTWIKFMVDISVNG